MLKESPRCIPNIEGANSINALEEYKDFDTIPGCFGEYDSDISIACYRCNLRLPCARNTAGRN